MKILSAALVAATLASPVAATTLQITVENLQSAPENGIGGFALTPVYSAFHNGNFDSYDLGVDVSAGVELLAELGDSSLLPGERTAPGVSPGSVATVINNAGPLDGGEIATGIIEITDFENQRFFSYLSMVVPTNDIFIANGNPTAFNLFNDDGSFVGPTTINVTGSQLRDAGTEANDPSLTGGAAFAAGRVGPDGVDTRGTTGVTEAFFALEEYQGVLTPRGYVAFAEPLSFFGDPANASQFGVARITIQEVAPVPLPAGGVLLLTALGLGGVVSRRKSKK